MFFVREGVIFVRKSVREDVIFVREGVIFVRKIVREGVVFVREFVRDAIVLSEKNVQEGFFCVKMS